MQEDLVNRIAAGIVAALVAAATGVGLSDVEVRAFDRIPIFWWILLAPIGVGVAVLAAADKLGFLREVYTEPTRLGFNDNIPPDPAIPRSATENM